MWILETASDNQIEVVIKKATIVNLPIIEDGWSFDWRKQFAQPNTQTFILQDADSMQVQGVVQLKTDGEMLLMNILKININYQWIQKKI